VFEGIGCAADKVDPAGTVGAADVVDTAHLVVLSNAYLRVVVFLQYWSYPYRHGLVRQNVFLFLLMDIYHTFDGKALL
jgi:hypothetical protein